jgi:hypothetical protein
VLEFSVPLDEAEAGERFSQPAKELLVLSFHRDLFKISKLIIALR